MIRRMVNSLFLLFLLIVSVSAQKQGDFGIFSVCSKNNTVRLKCYYAECKDSPSFSCDFYSNGTHLGGFSDSSCEFTDPQLPTSVINYTCILKRKKRTENKTVLIDPNSKDINDKLKICSGTPGLQLYQTPTFLWPLIVLPLWGVLETDRWLT